MLKHFLDDFLAKVPFQLPQLLDTSNMGRPQFQDDFVLLTFTTSESFELEEVMDMFEDDMELIMLYHHLPANGNRSGQATCAYSNPAFGQMFKMNAHTDTNGKVSEIQVTIYDSLEVMYGDLCLDLKLHRKKGSFKYSRSKDCVLLDFI